MAGPFFLYCVFDEVEHTELKEAGLWLRGQTQKPIVLMAASSRTPYYAGARQLVMPHASPELTLKHALAHGATYVAVEERYVEANSPCGAWRDPDRAPPALELAYKCGGNGRPAVLIYRVNRGLPEKQNTAK